MIINPQAYPVDHSSADGERWARAYTLAQLYAAKNPGGDYHSSLVFGEKMDTSNVACYANENSVLTGYSSYELDSNGNFVIGEHTPGASNIRWGWWSDRDENTSGVYSGYNRIDTNANTYFINDSPNTPDELNHGYIWQPFTALHYSDFWMSCRFVVYTLPNGQNPYYRILPRENIADELFENGYTRASHGVDQVLCGISVSFYSCLGDIDRNLNTLVPMSPMLETYTPNGIFFGTPFGYANSAFFNNYQSPSIFYDNGSREIYPWYNAENFNTFGVNESNRIQTTIRTHIWHAFTQTNAWTLGTPNSGFLTWAELDAGGRGTFTVNSYDTPAMGAYRWRGDPGAGYIPIVTGAQCMNAVASFGCLFSFSNREDLRAFTPNTLDTLSNEQASYIYLGKLYADGHTDGTYITGRAILSERQLSTHTSVFDIEFTPVDTSRPYVPHSSTDDEITTEKHNSETSLPTLDGVRTVSGDAFCTFYNLSLYHVRELGNIIAKMPQTFWDALGTATDAKQSNILDYIVSLKWYPVLLHDSSDTVAQSIQFGFNGDATLTLTAAGTSYRVSNINKIFDMGTISISYRSPKQTFLDAEPYTSVSIYLPYIGTSSLHANDVLGHTLACTYDVDFTTGMCTALVANEFDTLYIGTGKIGVDISVSGNDILTQSEKMASAYMGTALCAVGTTLSLGASAASENVSGTVATMVTGLSDVASSALSIANSKRGIPETVGTASGFGGAYTHQFPYITVRRPAVAIPGSYGHDIGYVCNRTYTIGALSGFTVCRNPDLSGITATSAEIDMIRNILCTGFYA